MRHVIGLVCLVQGDDLPDTTLLFGKTRDGMRGAENFEMNGMIPFATYVQASTAARFLRIRGESCQWVVTVARIRMRIMETEEELTTPRWRQNLVVIQKPCEAKFTPIYGRMVEKKPTSYPLPCAPIVQNGFATFRTWADAEYVAREVHRQAQSPVAIASFFLTRL